MVIVKVKRKAYVDTVVQMIVYIYLLNAVCKYFLPGTLTKTLPIIAVVLAALKTNEPFRLQISRIDRPFIAFGIVWLIGCLYSTAITKGVGYVLSFAVAFTLGLYLRKNELNEKEIVKFLVVSCTILVVCVIVQPIIPDVISNINQYFSYSADEYYVMNAWMRNGWYSGLFPDRAPAAFYGVILIGTGLYYLLCNYNLNVTKFQRLFGAIFAILGVYGVLLTAKRGLLIGALAASFISYIVYKKANQTAIWKICIAALLVVAVVWFSFSNLEATQIMLLRFFDNDDIMTGRTKIYSIILTVFSSSPIWGSGTASAFDVLGVGGHNIYLTVFMENGIVGGLIFIYAVGNALIFTIKNALKYGKKGYGELLPFLVFSLYIQVFFLVYGMSGNPLYDNYILYFYLFAILITKNTEYRYSVYKNKEEG